MDNHKFILDNRYADLLEELGVPYKEGLKKANLPENFLQQNEPSMTIEECIRFMDAIKELLPNNSVAIKIAQCESLESFYPIIFAAYCNKNTLMCIRILSKYKKLIGPLRLIVEEKEDEITVEMDFIGEKKLPELLVAVEMVIFVQIIRKATNEHIIPKEVITEHNLDTDDYEEFFGVRPKKGLKNIIVISKEDALIPFASENKIMWEYLEPELNKRIKEFKRDESYSAGVRNALIELLPRGEGKIDDVAKHLKCSKRTLQRKLSEENTTFQKQLNHVRELLAKHYLKNSGITTDEIAYLLGYQDLTSFLRAFQIWTGMTISEYKREIMI